MPLLFDKSAYAYDFISRKLADEKVTIAESLHFRLSLLFMHGIA